MEPDVTKKIGLNVPQLEGKLDLLRPSIKPGPSKKKAGCPLQKEI
jgi:hypothetical protein